MFARRARGKTAGSKSASVDLELEDFTIEKTQQYFEAWAWTLDAIMSMWQSTVQDLLRIKFVEYPQKNITP